MSEHDHQENQTDLGNARRFVRIYGKRLRFCERLGGWFVFNGPRWARDERRWVDRTAKEIPRDLMRDAAALLEKGERKELANFALRTESEARLKALVNLARSEPGIALVPEDFDADVWKFNLLNGTLDLHTGELHKHDRADLITKVAGVKYDPEASAPKWEKFLAEIIPQPGLAAYLQRAVGLSMIGESLEHVLLFLYGTGANGKSTFLRTLQALFGDYAKQADPELLLVRRSDVHPTGKAALVSTRLVVTTEVEDGRRLHESLVKSLTGGDRVTARFMRRDFFEFDPTWTIWMAANHKPTIRGTDHAMWRRVKLLPFDVTIPAEDQDPELVDKLVEELPGILNWAVAGCLQYQRDGLRDPVAVMSATNAYRSESDTLGVFLEEETSTGSDLLVEATALYRRYQDWAKRSGEHAVTQRKFGLSLSERGYEKGRSTKTGRKIYYCLDLNPEPSLNLLNHQQVTSHEGENHRNIREKVQQGSEGSEREVA